MSENILPVFRILRITDVFRTRCSFIPHKLSFNSYTKIHLDYMHVEAKIALSCFS